MASAQINVIVVHVSTFYNQSQSKLLRTFCTVHLYSHGLVSQGAPRTRRAAVFHNTLKVPKMFQFLKASWCAVIILRFIPIVEGGRRVLRIREDYMMISILKVPKMIIIEPVGFVCSDFMKCCRSPDLIWLWNTFSEYVHSSENIW